jgi:predicted ATP-dependent protease
MFRVLVDFDEDIPMVDESLEQFAQLLKTRTSEEGMAPLTADAVARLATYSARLAEPGAFVGAHRRSVPTGQRGGFHSSSGQ